MSHRIANRKAGGSLPYGTIRCVAGIDSWGIVPQDLANRFIKITTTSPLIEGSSEGFYTDEIEATPAPLFPNAEVTFEIVDGALPDGLIFSLLGYITGDPKEKGTFSFLVQAKSTSNGQTQPIYDLKEFSIKIN